jgi:hypothetical protein
MQAVVESLLRAYPEAVRSLRMPTAIFLTPRLLPRHTFTSPCREAWETRTVVVRLALVADIRISRLICVATIVSIGRERHGWLRLCIGRCRRCRMIDVQSNTVAYLSILHDACGDQVGIDIGW